MFCMSFPFKQPGALQLLTYLEKVTQGYTQPPEDISILSLQHKLNFSASGEVGTGYRGPG